MRRPILAPEARIYEFLRSDTVGELVGEHLRGETNRRLLIWSLISFEWWCRTFLDGPRARAAAAEPMPQTGRPRR